MVNIVCLKWGNKYSSEYVNKLYNMVKRNISYDFNFICFTEDSSGLDSNIKTLPLLDKKLNGWWNKLWLFSSQVANQLNYEPTLYLDLDIILVDNIDCFFDIKKDFVIIHEWMRNKHKNASSFNSSVIKYNPGMFNHIWENFEKNATQIMKTYPGDQDWISKQVPSASVWPENWCKSFKWHCTTKNNEACTVPSESRIIVFHGLPNPHDLITGTSKYPYVDWVKEYWK